MRLSKIDMLKNQKCISNYQQFLTPIVLFVYNRPWHTRQTVEALRKNELAGQSDLIIYSDGPKTDADKSAVGEVRQYIHGLSGFKNIIIRERNKNFGLADSIISGVTEVVKKYGRVIVLEDDLVTSPYFLRYMNDALKRYENNENVMQVAAYMFPNNLTAASDAFFMPFVTTWGWGTWKRAWDRLDVSKQGFEALKQNRALRRAFDLNGAYDFFRLYENKYKGKNNSWGILWYSTIFFNKGIVLFPVQTLAYHIGYDNSGTNCNATEIPQQRLSAKPVVNLPAEAAVDEVVYDAFLKDFRLYWKRVRRLQRVMAGRKLVAAVFRRIWNFWG